jgi:hypothetical protein
MSEATFDAVDSEVFESSGEGNFEGEAAEINLEGEVTGEAQYEGYPEDARSDASRRARQRQILLARQRQAQARRPVRSPQPRRPVVTAPSQRQAMTAIRSLDLDTKVELDSLRRALNEANRLAYRNAWAAEASVAASQVLDSFNTGLAPHDWAKALIRGAPTLLLAPGKPRRPGLEGILFDPRGAGGLVLGGIWAVGHFRGQGQGVTDIRISYPSTIDTGDTGKFGGVPVNSHGETVTTATVTWTSDNSAILAVDQTTGAYEAGKISGSANITASVDNVQRPFSVAVVAVVAAAPAAAAKK